MTDVTLVTIEDFSKLAEELKKLFLHLDVRVKNQETRIKQLDGKIQTLTSVLINKQKNK